MHYVYVLENLNDGEWYIGETKDLKQRVKNHNKGKTKHTRKNTPWELIFYLAFKKKSDAKRFEKYLKSGYGRKFLKNTIQDYIKENNPN